MKLKTTFLQPNRSILKRYSREGERGGFDERQTYRHSFGVPAPHFLHLSNFASSSWEFTPHLESVGKTASKRPDLCEQVGGLVGAARANIHSDTPATTMHAASTSITRDNFLSP